MQRSLISSRAFLNLFESDSWKIGPFDEYGKLKFDTDYIMTDGTFTGNGVSIGFIMPEGKNSPIYLDLEGAEYDGYYNIVTGVTSGSYGDLDKIGGKPVVTNYWERTDNYLLYYNDTTKPTFHSSDNGANGFDVKVTKGNDGYIRSSTNTYSAKFDGSQILTLSTTDEEIDATWNDDEVIQGITYSQEGYNVVGFRYKLIDLDTTAAQVNTATEDNGWYYTTDPGDWVFKFFKKVYHTFINKGPWASTKVIRIVIKSYNLVEIVARLTFKRAFYKFFCAVTNEKLCLFYGDFRIAKFAHC